MSTSPGRNDPCPCGSGKKFKRCCADTFQANLRDDSLFSQEDATDLLDDEIHGLHPYTMARILNNPPDEAVRKLSREAKRRMAEDWSISKVQKLSQAEIAERLQKFGIDPSLESFCKRSKQFLSAWEFGESWLNNPDLRTQDAQFICLAACELWKYYCPDRPSMEMIDDWMQDGYKIQEAGDEAQAIEIWQKVWNVLKSRFTPEMRKCAATKSIFDGYQSLSNWVQDFKMALFQAAFKDQPSAEWGTLFSEEFLRQFPDEDELMVMNFQSDLGFFYFLNEQKMQGEVVFKRMIDEHPTNTHGYACWAEALCWGKTRKDFKQALSLLEQAFAVPVTNPEAWDLQRRLEDCRDDLSKM